MQYKQETKQRAEEQLEYASKVAEQSASEANGEGPRRRRPGSSGCPRAGGDLPNPNPKSLTLNPNLARTPALILILTL